MAPFQRRQLSPTLWIVFLTLFALEAFAEFTLQAPPKTFQQLENMRLVKSDVDERDESTVKRFQADASGGLNETISEEPGLFALKIGASTEITLVPESGSTIDIRKDDRTGEMTVGNAPASQWVDRYESFRKESLGRLVYPVRGEISKARRAMASPQVLEDLTEQEVEAYQAHLRELNDFAIDEIGSSLALYATSLRWTSTHRFDELSALVDALEKEVGALSVVRSMQNRIARFESVALGAEAPPLAGTDLQSDYHSLTDYKGRYVLVDFWASWCPPCRLENENYGEIKSRFEDAPLILFSVNLDQSRQAWARASREDGIDWIQISDLAGWESPLAKRYNVSALPASFLLDPEGRIIAKDLRGEALVDKLADLLP